LHLEPLISPLQIPEIPDGVNIDVTPSLHAESDESKSELNPGERRKKAFDLLDVLVSDDEEDEHLRPDPVEY
jgi:hypothetical protein